VLLPARLRAGLLHAGAQPCRPGGTAALGAGKHRRAGLQSAEARHLAWTLHPHCSWLHSIRRDWGFGMGNFRPTAGVVGRATGGGEQRRWWARVQLQDPAHQGLRRRQEPPSLLRRLEREKRERERGTERRGSEHDVWVHNFFLLFVCESNRWVPRVLLFFRI
jgi:hypothetical protein